MSIIIDRFLNITQKLIKQKKIDAAKNRIGYESVYFFIGKS